MTPTVLADGGLYYQGGCRVHGTSIVLPEDEEAETLFPQPVTKNGGHRGLTETMRRRSQNSQSVSPSPLASPVPPLGPAPPYDHSNCSDRMHKSCACVNFIAEHTKAREEATKVKSIDDYFLNPALQVSNNDIVKLHCLRHGIEFLPFTAFFSNCRICEPLQKMHYFSYSSEKVQ